MAIINLISPFLDNHLSIIGEINYPSYPIETLDNVLFIENINIFPIIDRPLNDININIFNYYTIEDILPENYYSTTVIQDLPGILLPTTFDKINAADRLYKINVIILPSIQCHAVNLMFVNYVDN